MFGYGVAFVAATGLTAALIPIQVILIVSAGVLMVVLLAKLVADNARLAKQFPGKRLITVFGKTLLCFLPIALLLAPGFYLGSLVQYETERGIDSLDDWVGTFSVEQAEQKLKALQEQQSFKTKAVIFIGMFLIPDYVEQQVEAFKKSVKAPLHVRTTAGTLKAALLAISVYSTAWVFVLFIRAFASLFGRILVSGDTPVSFSIGSTDDSKSPSAALAVDEVVLKEGAILSITIGEGSCLFVRGADLPVNAPPDIVLNWRSGGSLLRLRHGLICLNQLTADVTGLVTEFHASGSHRYVLAQIKEGQEIVVDPAHLVAFTEQIRFKSSWNFNLAALALHRPASFIVSGPGQVVLKCDGQPLTFHEASTAPAIALDKLILFERDAQFEIRASKGLLNYFAASCVVQPRAGSLFIATPEAPRSASFFAKLWGLLKQVYLPI